MEYEEQRTPEFRYEKGPEIAEVTSMYDFKEPLLLWNIITVSGSSK